MDHRPLTIDFMAFKFENLKVWQFALELTHDIDMIANSFPKHELYSLSSQVRRAVNSISLNIVEGSTGQSNAEFRRFLVMANRSALEVVGCLFIARRRNYLNEGLFNQVYDKITTLVKMLQALIKSLK
jgi:four helix bundle protein